MANQFDHEGSWYTSARHGFALQMSFQDQSLGILLRRTRRSDVWLESLELALRTKAPEGVSLHPDLSSTTRFQIFKQGYLGASISNKKEARDRNAWSYHESSHARNPEQPLTQSLYQTSWQKLLRRLPPRGFLYSDGMIMLEELLDDEHHEWGSEKSSPLKKPVQILFAAGHAGQQSVRFFVELDPQSDYLKEWRAIWDRLVKASTLQL